MKRSLPSRFFPIRIERVRNVSGVTLVELLVVVAILGILLTLMVPRLRMINEDQGMREAGRVVGSRMARASREAIRIGSRPGGGGFMLELNPNLLDADNVQYAATVLYLLKPVPPYSGDSMGSTARREGGFNFTGGFQSHPDYTLSIPRPLEQAARGIVMVDDQITVNNGSVRYRIMAVQEVGPRLLLGLSRGIGMDNPGNPMASLPPLPGVQNSEFAFTIHRQPRIQESSRLELPEGYLIDMRYSGELVGPPYFSNRSPLLTSGAVPVRTIFHEPSPVMPAVIDRSFQVLFKPDGTVDHYRHFGVPISTGQRIRIPEDNLYFFLTKIESNPLNENILSNPSPLDRAGNLWLVLNIKTGGVTINYNVPPPIGLPFHERIQQARILARTGRTTTE